MSTLGYDELLQHSYMKKDEIMKPNYTHFDMQESLHRNIYNIYYIYLCKCTPRMIVERDSTWSWMHKDINKRGFDISNSQPYDKVNVTVIIVCIRYIIM